jgi:hypothetical protein
MDEFWDRYWKRLFRRFERKTGWILFIAGAVLIAAWEIYQGIRNFGEINFIKIALLIFGAGALFLLISVIRERIHQYRDDKYKDITR